MISVKKFKVGHYYKGTNRNGSYLYFKILERDVKDNCASIEIIKDNDIRPLAYPSNKTITIWLSQISLGTYFSMATEVTNVSELLALML